MHWLWLAVSGRPSLAHPDCGITIKEPTLRVQAMKNGKQTRSAKDILAAKHGIYSWPLDSPFQMLDHVKHSINITCAGAFMGPHPLLLIYIPQPTQCCNHSCADACFTREQYVRG